MEEWSALKQRQADLSRMMKEKAEYINVKRKRGVELLKRSVVWKTMCCLMAMYAGDRTMAEQYAQSMKWTQAHAGELVPELTAWYAQLHQSPIEFRRNAMADANLRHCLRRADKFVEETLLESWVTRVNLSTGITPCSQTVLRQLSRQDTRNITRHTLRGVPRGKTTSFQWLRRWRRRWTVRMSMLPCGEQLDPELKLYKVLGQKSHPGRLAFVARQFARITKVVPISGLQMKAPCEKRRKRGARKRHHFLHPGPTGRRFLATKRLKRSGLGATSCTDKYRGGCHLWSSTWTRQVCDCTCQQALVT